MPRTLTAFALALLLAACGSDATGPEPRTALDLTGSYVLDGGIGSTGHFTAPPVATTGFGTIYGSTLALRENGTFTMTMDQESSGVRDTKTNEGTYQARADSTLTVRFDRSGSVRAGRLQADGRVMLDWEYYRLHYRRQ